MNAYCSSLLFSRKDNAIMFRNDKAGIVLSTCYMTFIARRNPSTMPHASPHLSHHDPPHSPITRNQTPPVVHIAQWNGMYRRLRRGAESRSGNGRRCWTWRGRYGGAGAFLVSAASGGYLGWSRGGKDRRARKLKRGSERRTYGRCSGRDKRRPSVRIQ